MENPLYGRNKGPRLKFPGVGMPVRVEAVYAIDLSFIRKFYNE